MKKILFLFSLFSALFIFATPSFAADTITASPQYVSAYNSDTSMTFTIHTDVANLNGWRLWLQSSDYSNIFNSIGTPDANWHKRNEDNTQTEGQFDAENNTFTFTRTINIPSSKTLHFRREQDSVTADYVLEIAPPVPSPTPVPVVVNTGTVMNDFADQCLAAMIWFLTNNVTQAISGLASIVLVFFIIKKFREIGHF